MFKNEYWVWEQAIPKSICEALLNELDWNDSTSGTINNDGSPAVDKKIRVTDVIWHHQLSVLGSIAQTYIGTANTNANWNFLVNGLEQIQIGRYTPNGHYDWHRDTGIDSDAHLGDGLVRKLSFSMLLNDPSEFEGGELEIKASNGNILTNLLTKQGSIVVFPSYLEHRVTPVTSGTRYTTVAWANGPQFR